MRHSLIIIVIVAAGVVLGTGVSDGLSAAQDPSARAGGDRVALAAAAGVSGAALEKGKPSESEKSDDLPTKEPARGKRERRLSRMEGWVASLEGDKERIYKKYGHPSGRYREEAMGSVVEKWVYSDKGKTFVFKGNKLVRGY